MTARRSRRSLLTTPSECGMQRTSRYDPIQVSQWKRQLLEDASEMFTKGKKSKDKEEGQAKEAKLFQQIGRLQMEPHRKLLACLSRAAFEGSSWPDAKPGSLHAPSEAFHRFQLHQRLRDGPYLCWRGKGTLLFEQP